MLNAANHDGYRLEVLDLVESRVVFSVSPSTGLLPDGYSFVVSAKALEKIFVKHVTLGRFAYDSSGRFLDAKSFQAAQLEKGDYVQKLVAIRALIESDKTLEAATRAVPITQQALAEGANARPDWASIAFRVQGEAYERLSHPVAALLAYEQALSINRKIAVRNRIRELRKVVFDSSPR